MPANAKLNINLEFGHLRYLHARYFLVFAIFFLPEKKCQVNSKFKSILHLVCSNSQRLVFLLKTIVSHFITAIVLHFITATVLLHDQKSDLQFIRENDNPGVIICMAEVNKYNIYMYVIVIIIIIIISIFIGKIQQT